jgi:predicted nucleic acid-binding protein
VKRVFVDSGAFFALLVAQDASHAAASKIFQSARDERWELTTTNVVVIET